MCLHDSVLTYHCEVSLPLLGVEGRAALRDLALVAARRVEVHLLQHHLVHPDLQQLEEREEKGLRTIPPGGT